MLHGCFKLHWIGIIERLDIDTIIFSCFSYEMFIALDFRSLGLIRENMNLQPPYNGVLSIFWFDEIMY